MTAQITVTTAAAVLTLMSAANPLVDRNRLPAPVLNSEKMEPRKTAKDVPFRTSIWIFAVRQKTASIMKQATAMPKASK